MSENALFTISLHDVQAVRTGGPSADFLHDHSDRICGRIANIKHVRFGRSGCVALSSRGVGTPRSGDASRCVTRRPASGTRTGEPDHRVGEAPVKQSSPGRSQETRRSRIFYIRGFYTSFHPPVLCTLIRETDRNVRSPALRSEFKTEMFSISDVLEMSWF